MSAIPAKPSRWKRLGQNLALSFATFVLCIAALEVLLRLNHYGNLEICNSLAPGSGFFH